MINGLELQETSQVRPSVELGKPHESRSLQSEILIPKAHLGTQLWPQMLQKTQSGIETGIIISFKKKDQKILVSNIFEGTHREYKDETTGQQETASIIPPMFPHGYNPLTYLGIESSLFVHAHPKPSHLSTSIITDEDIKSLLASTYSALTMIDEGGAHLLVYDGSLFRGDTHFVDFIDNMIDNVRKKGETIKVTEAMQQIAQGIRAYNLKYYFHSFESGLPTEDNVLFKAVPTK